MNFFDFQIIKFVNHFSQHSLIFDNVINILQGNKLLKGGVLLTIFWYAWFKREERNSQNREQIISTLFCSVIALALARTLAVMLPFRIRPLHEAGLRFLLPFGTDPGTLM
jgi:undecaprenyl-diphosphatase